MLAWFQALMPKEERFFDLFDRHAVTLVAGARSLRSLLEGDESAPHHCQEIKRHENEADEITRDVLLAVRRTFITPFDRSDIRDLITAMDDTIDQMHQTAKATLIYETRDFEAANAAHGRHHRSGRRAHPGLHSPVAIHAREREQAELLRRGDFTHRGRSRHNPRPRSDGSRFARIAIPIP